MFCLMVLQSKLSILVVTLVIQAVDERTLQQICQKLKEAKMILHLPELHSPSSWIGSKISLTHKDDGKLFTNYTKLTSPKKASN